MRANKFISKRSLLVLAGCTTTLVTHAADKVPVAESGSHSLFSSVLFWVMFMFILLLTLGIIAMTELVKGGASHRNFRNKKKKENSSNTSKTIALLLSVTIGNSLLGQVTQDKISAEVPFDYWGMGSTAFISMSAVIVVEAIIFYVLYRTGIWLLRDETKIKPLEQKKSWWKRSAVIKSMIEATPAEEEQAILLDHDYDGIKELDNNLPGWWKYGFYLTILVAVVYLLHYHVLKTGYSSSEEYVQEQLAAEKQIAEYKKSTANLVDENTVVRLLDASSISAGHGVYLQNCVPCHGEFGEGKEGLGPNLTDDYWMHQGGTANIFKSIKYGWTDKGMKSWEQDLKPLEIQQIVSWIQSIRGTNPPNAKAPEGELFLEEGSIVSDSLDTDDTIEIKNTDSIVK